MNLIEKKTWVFGVANACPLNYPLNTCLFKQISEMPVVGRWNYINKLSEEELDNLIEKHKRCLFERELKRNRQ
jgi:hypothetical protein